MTSRLATLCLLAALAGPANAQSLADALGDDPRFETFAAALRETGLADPAGVGTVFAPTDEAFSRVSEGVLDRLDEPEAAAALRAVVALHLVPEGPHESDDLPVEMPTLAEGARIVVTYTRGTLTLRPAPVDATDDVQAALAARAVTEARVRVGDIEAAGRLVHGIDMVMLPPNLDAMLAAADAARAVSPVATPAETVSVPEATTRPKDYAAQVAAVDDGPTVAVVPDEGGVAARPAGAVEDVDTGGAAVAEVEIEASVAPEPDATSTVRIVPLERAAGEPDAPETVARREGTQVTVFETTGSTTAAPVRPEPEAPGRIVTLPAETDPTPNPAVRPVEAAPPATADTPSEDQVPAIDLAGEVISVADLIGRAVRDGTGAELGEVTDVLISLDGGTVRTIVYEETGGLLSLDAIGIGEPETRRVDVSGVSIDPLDGSVIVREPVGDDG